MASLAGSPLDQLPQPATRPRSALSEWPTWAVWAGHYGAFAALTWFWTAVPLWLSLPLAAYIICLNAHLMHEVLHGHPTRSRSVNRLLVLPNLTAWIPYEIYRDSHIAHHRTHHLAHPTDDPESFYVLPSDWARHSAPMRWLLRVNNSMAGRMLIGPVLIIGRFWASEIRRYANGDTAYLGAWGILLLSNLTLGLWLFAVCEVPVWQYALAFYAGAALMTVRSFIEHRPAGDQDARCAIVEGGPLMQLLFLNNCFHLVHHDRPELPWYEIPAVYRADREGWKARTRGHWFPGYWSVMKRYALTPKDSPRFPEG
jgi:fatty acid desaturase